MSLNIASSSSLLVKFGEPLNRNGAVVTKYKGKQLIVNILSINEENILYQTWHKCSLIDHLNLYFFGHPLFYLVAMAVVNFKIKNSLKDIYDLSIETIESI